MYHGANTVGFRVLARVYGLGKAAGTGGADAGRSAKAFGLRIAA